MEIGALGRRETQSAAAFWGRRCGVEVGEKENKAEENGKDDGEEGGLGGN